MTRRYLRPGVLAGHVLVLIAVLTCLRLGWWQWDVTHEARGTVQNLGYALLWPTFGAAFIYMWLRFLQLEDVREREDSACSIDDQDGSGAGDHSGRAVTIELAAMAPEPARPNNSAPDIEPATYPDREGGGDPDAARVDLPAPADEVDSPPARRGRRRTADRPIEILSVATVSDDDGDDPELAAYNRALAELAEQDRRRAR